METRMDQLRMDCNLEKGEADYSSSHNFVSKMDLWEQIMTLLLSRFEFFSLIVLVIILQLNWGIIVPF